MRSIIRNRWMSSPANSIKKKKTWKLNSKCMRKCLQPQWIKMMMGIESKSWKHSSKRNKRKINSIKKIN